MTLRRTRSIHFPGGLSMKQVSISAALAGSLAAMLGGIGASPTAAAAMADARPLLETHCFDCHGFGAKEGNLALDELLDAEDSPANRAVWRKVWKMVRQEFMPPADAAPMEPADRKTLTQWVERSPLGVDYDHPDPGRVTMRRLNRMEFEHTVNDLFGVEIAVEENLSSLSQGKRARLRDMLPPDDTAYGFDNIGDFQTLSPALLEKYFDIAELVVSQVIVTDGPWYPSIQVERSAIDVDSDRETKRTVQVARFNVPEDGEYQVDIQFYLGGWQEYGGGFDFTLDFDDERIAAKLIDVGGQETHRFERDGRLAAGEHVVTFVTKAVKPDSEGQLVNLRLSPKITVTGPIAADRRSYPESHQRIFFNGEPPENAAERRQYARDILERVATRAFRRPVDDAMLDRLTELAMTEETFERGIGHGLMAILTSPRFLFRTELQPQPDDPAARHPIDDYALASRLSYLLWLSLPDEALMTLAAAGTLREHLDEQVARMLADPRSERFLEDFVGQWLRTRNVLMTPISRREDEIDAVRTQMKRETDMLFEHLVREDRDLLELITANYTFLDQRLANFYGISGVQGDEFRRVELPADSHRGGVLTHGSFLVSTSNPDRTSPVKRGLFVLENLLATQPPPPPANVPALEDAKVEGKTLRTVREQLEAHRADPACAACHAHFDPIGLVLENYDVLGLWREDERGETIDPSGTTVTGEDLSGIDDLRDYVAGNRERYYRCVAEKLMTYSLGRGLEPYDAVTIDQMTDAMLAEGGRFSTLLTMVVKSPAFQMRRGDDDSDLDATARAAIPDIPPPEKRKPDPRRFRRFQQRLRELNRDREGRREEGERGEREERAKLEADRDRDERDADERGREPDDDNTNPDRSPPLDGEGLGEG
jgi:hypothetical protein